MRLSSKFINKAVVGLLLVAPIVYLFGALFCGLIGAHGAEVYAEPDTYSYALVEGDVSSSDMLRVVISEDMSPSGSGSQVSNFISNGRSFTTMRLTSAGLEYRPEGSNSYIVVWSFSNGWLNGEYRFLSMFGSTYTAFLNGGLGNLFNSFATVYYRVASPTPSSNVEFVFEQFFSRDNWLKSIGEETLKDNPRGFAPIASLISYLDTNMLHFSTSQVGLMAYGYLYWCFHVLLLDLAFYISVFFVRIIKKLAEKIEGGVE